ncbi:MAG: hypothetical protein ACXVB9_01930 [Bdellovibrionota bacterium]
MSAACPSCGLRLEGLSISLAPPAVVLTGVQFHTGDPRDSAVHISVERLNVPVPLANLREGPWKLGVVTVDGAKVLVHEGDALFPSAPASGAAGKGFEAAGLLVRSAEFTYRKDSPAGAAYIRVHEVNADAGPFGTSALLHDQQLIGHADARLEKSGAVTLGVAAAFFAASPNVKVDLALDGQNLSDVNPYFEVEEGVTLNGRVLRSHSLVSLQDTAAKGDVEVAYEGLKLKFHSNRHRGGLSALLDNLGVTIKVKGENSGDIRSKREREVETRRHPRESVVSFILRTMREAAMRVAAP